jgi:hypothetical protein
MQRVIQHEKALMTVYHTNLLQAVFGSALSASRAQTRSPAISGRETILTIDLLQVDGENGLSSAIYSLLTFKGKAISFSEELEKLVYILYRTT